MHFDNRQTVLDLNKRKYLILLGYFTLIGIIFFSGLFDQPVLNLSKGTYVIAFTVLYSIYLIYTYIMNFNFFSFSDDGDKLVFKYVSMRPFDSEKKAIKINKTEFGGYEFEKSFFDLKEELILKIKTNKGLANYPPISISSLSVKQKKLLKAALNQFIQD